MTRPPLELLAELETAIQKAADILVNSFSKEPVYNQPHMPEWQACERLGFAASCLPAIRSSIEAMSRESGELTPAGASTPTPHPLELLAELAKAIESKDHYECDDGYYSCPKHPDYFGRDDRGVCSCGKDQVDELLPALRAALEAQEKASEVDIPRILKLCEKLSWKMENGNSAEALDAARVARQVVKILSPVGGEGKGGGEA